MGANAAATFVCDNLNRARKRKWLRKNSEPLVEDELASRDETKAIDCREPCNPGSETKAWNVAVADVHLGISHQQAVELGQQAAEPGAGGGKGDCGLGHFHSLVSGAARGRLDASSVI